MGAGRVRGFGALPPESGPDVKAIRAKTRLSQAKFAESLREPYGQDRASTAEWAQREWERLVDAGLIGGNK